jgi:hypothetical protein
MARSRPLPVRSRAEVLDAFPTLRQSLLASFDDCRLKTRWQIEGVEFDSSAQARGQLFHRYAAEVLRTLWRTGENSMPTEEALVILYECVSQRDVPDRDVVWLPAKERRILRKCAIALVYDHAAGMPRQFEMQRLIAVEGTSMEGGDPLKIPLGYPDARECPYCAGEGRALLTEIDGRTTLASQVRGTVDQVYEGECPTCYGSGWEQTGGMVERIATGRPDAVLAVPPDGLEILDWKTDRQPPPKGEENDEHRDDAEHVSYGGYFQQRTYGVGALRRWPHVKWVRLREFYVLAGEARWATIHREHMEHIERELAAEVELLDRALMGGHKSEIWSPSPGHHCRYCPRSGQCPIPREERGEGAIGDSAAVAARYGAQAVVAQQVYKDRIASLKPYVNEFGPVDVRHAKGRLQWRWKEGTTGKRTFGLHVPEASDRGPEDPALASAFEEAKQRKAAA